MRTLETNVRDVVSDGQRYFAWQRLGSRRIAVLDGLTGKTVSSRMPEGCQLRAAGLSMRDRTLMIACRRGRTRVFDWRGGKATVLPSEGELAGVLWFDIGRYWIGGDDVACPASTSYSPRTCYVYLHRVSGRRVFSTEPRDIDRGSLPVHRACGLLLRPSSQRVFDRPWLVGGRTPESSTGGLWLHRCGTGSRRRLSSRTWRDARIGGGLVTWRMHTSVYVHVISTRRTYAWQVTPGSGILAAGRTALAITTERLDCSTKTCESASYRLSRARVPSD